MGRPEGGLYDEDPPILLQSDPVEGAVEVQKQRIHLHFNENIKLDNINEKMVVSPPQQKTPHVSSNAKNLTVELIDSLQENTTYTIDFCDAIQDNNEGNPLEGLSLTFSTGDHIDSLKIEGHLLNAENLEPITGAYVGIYKMNEGDSCFCADSLFISKRFERSGKSDAYGSFKILGCAPGTYYLYGLVDGNNNYQYDMESEDIAFLSQPIILDESTLPDSTLMLYAFNEGKVIRYLDDVSRPDSNHINVRFATWMPEAPKFTFLLPDSSRIDGDSVLIAQLNPTLDTLVYWIKDTTLIQLDTLNFDMSYLYTDTLKMDVWKIESFSFEKPVVSVPKPESNKKSRKRKGKKEEEETLADSIQAPVTIFMQLKMLSAGSIDIGQKPRFETSAPLDSLHTERIHLQMQKDTLWVDMSFKLVPDSIHPLRFTMIAEPHFSPGGSYRVQVDSAAMHNIYGHPLDKCQFTFKEKKIEEYAHLLFNVTGIEGPAYVELLNSSDKPLYRADVINKQAKFINVSPSTYYVRLIADTNNNGRFDAGNLFEHIQPERVYYFGSELQLRGNWSINQNWDVNELPVLKQKPDQVKKNKPKEKKEKKSKNEEYLRKRGKL